MTVGVDLLNDSEQQSVVFRMRRFVVVKYLADAVVSLAGDDHLALLAENIPQHRGRVPYELQSPLHAESTSKTAQPRKKNGDSVIPSTRKKMKAKRPIMSAS